MTIPLLEAGLYSYIRYLEPGGIAFLTTRRGNIPSVMVFPMDTDDVKTANHTIIVRANARAANRKFFKEDPDNTHYDALYRKLRQSKDLVTQLDAMYEYPELFKIFTIQGRERMYKFLTTDLRMHPQHWKDYFGEIPEMGEDHVTKFHNAVVMVPDNMSKRSLNASLAALEEVFDHLNNHGLGFIFGCNIRFFATSGRKIGTYFPTVDEMRISPRAKKSGRVIHTLLHEYTHRLYGKFMAPEQKKVIVDKYNELRSGGERYKDTQAAGLLAATIEAYPPGMWMDYTGRKRNLRNYGPRYLIKRVDQVLGHAYLASEHEPHLARLKISVLSFLDTRQWKPAEGERPSVRKLEKHEIESEQWFPTDYSQTDHEEWFSELMALYLTDMLKGEPEQWVRGFLK